MSSWLKYGRKSLALCCQQRALAARNPNSVAALVAASKPTAAETAVVQELQGKLQKLQVSMSAECSCLSY